MGRLLDDFFRETVGARARARILEFAASEDGYLAVEGDLYGADLYRAEQVAVLWDDLDPTREERVPLDVLVRRALELPDL
ncbi:hypothetical protein [Cellulosimicrobium composti]|uniref:hypothetical protein n=1 Tax=Cellulosimicrobium composti TaxID=2672572 RepID=UPI0004635867|nr:hypothetical protein L603_000600001140 [Cellulosimicrobium cellulans J34]SMF40701.1 hypothetical protein SAMN02744115_03137 [Cellulosimicrobium cellulans J1]